METEIGMSAFGMKNGNFASRIGMSEYAYIIETRLPSGDVMYFREFYNIVENIGCDDEEQCFGNEDWVYSEEDAHKFKSYAEAKVFMENIPENDDCRIVLYGKADKCNFAHTHWYPLKVFKRI